MFCPNCGRNLPDDSRFCDNCGHAVQIVTPPVAPEANAYQAQYAQDNVPPVAPEANAYQAQYAQNNVPPVAPEANTYQAQYAQDNVPLVSPEANAYQAQYAQNNVLPVSPEANAYQTQYAQDNVPPVSPEANAYQAQNMQGGEQPQDINGENINVFYEVTEAPQKKKKKKMNKPLTAVIASVFGIFIFLFSFVSVTALCLKNGIESHSASEGIKKLELESLPVGDILGNEDIRDMFLQTGVKLPEQSELEEDNLAGAAAKIINNTVPVANVRASDVRKFLSESDLQQLIAELAGSYETYITTGKDIYDGDVTDRLRKAFKDNNKLASDLLNLELSYDFDEQFEMWVDDNYNTVSKIAPSKALKDFDFLIGIVMSPVFIIVLLVLALAMAALVFIITKRLKGSILTLGVSLTVSGIAIITVGVLLMNIASLSGFDFAAVREYILPAVTGGYSNAFIGFGLITAGVGIIAVIASVVMMVLAKKKSRTVVQV